MSDTLTLISRIGIGVVGLAVCTGAVIAATLVPLPTSQASTAGLSILPEPADSRYVCGGALLDADDPDSIQSLNGESTTFLTSGDAPSGTSLTSDDVSGTDATAQSFLVPAADDQAALSSGLVLHGVSTDTYSGLAALNCSQPAAESWLVSGSTDVGRTSLVVISNPSDVAATVDLTIYGENGRIEAAGSTGIVLPADTERVLPLAGLAPNVVAPVVRVVARGGEVSASMQSSVITGLTPRGVENSGTSATPATNVQIPGVVLTAQPEVPSSDDAGVTSDLQSVVRVVAPGDADANVNVSVVNNDTTGQGTTLAAVVPAGRVVELPLSGLSDGSYTVTVTSDQPVTAAARTTSTGDRGGDFGWFPSTTIVSGPFLVATAGSVTEVLHLVNPTADGQTITVAIDGRGDQTIELPSGQAADVPLSPRSRTLVSGATGVRASVSFVSQGLIASSPVLAPSALAGPITVYTH